MFRIFTLQRIAACTGLCLLLGCAGAQSFRIVTAPRAPIEVPLTIGAIPSDVPNSGRAYVSVAIADTSFPMFVDLGCFSTIALKSNALARLPVTVTATRTFSDAFGTKFTTRDYTIPSCRIGSLTCADIEGTEMQPDPWGSESAAGCIGEAFLSRFNVVFDYPHRILSLLQDTLLPERYRKFHWVTMPYYISNGNCVTTDVTIAGEKRKFIWDTGASFSVIRPEVIGDTAVAKHLVNVEHVVAGGHEFSSLQFVTLPFVEPDADALIGHNFFLDHIIVLNTADHTISVAD